MKALALTKAVTIIAASVLSTSVLASDWTVSAAQGCTTSLGSTSNYNGGLRASGTAVISCPLIKKVTTNAVTAVWARTHSANLSDADSFCYLASIPANGGVVSYGVNSKATSAVGNKSINVSLPESQAFSGYMDLYCVIQSGDTFFGARYMQVN